MESFSMYHFCFGASLMIALRDVLICDEGTYAVWQHDLKLTDYLSRLRHCSGVWYKYEKLPLYKS